MDMLFDLPQVYLGKKIRLVTLFSGIGSQEMALRDIGADFEIHRMVEFDKFAVKSYNAVHGTSFDVSDVRDVHASDLAIVDTDEYDYVMFYSGSGRWFRVMAIRVIKYYTDCNDYLKNKICVRGDVTFCAG